MKNNIQGKIRGNLGVLLLLVDDRGFSKEDMTKLFGKFEWLSIHSAGGEILDASNNRLVKTSKQWLSSPRLNLSLLEIRV